MEEELRNPELFTSDDSSPRAVSSQASFAEADTNSSSSSVSSPLDRAYSSLVAVSMKRKVHDDLEVQRCGRGNQMGPRQIKTSNRPEKQAVVNAHSSSQQANTEVSNRYEKEMLDAQNQLTEKTREILRLQIKNEDLRHQLREQDEGNIQKEQQEKFENLEKEGTDMKQMLAELEKQMDALKEDKKKKENRLVVTHEMVKTFQLKNHKNKRALNEARNKIMRTVPAYRQMKRSRDEKKKEIEELKHAVKKLQEADKTKSSELEAAAVLIRTISAERDSGIEKEKRKAEECDRMIRNSTQLVVNVEMQKDALTKKHKDEINEMVKKFEKEKAELCEEKARETTELAQENENLKLQMEKQYKLIAEVRKEETKSNESLMKKLDSLMRRD